MSHGKNVCEAEQCGRKCTRHSHWGKAACVREVGRGGESCLCVCVCECEARAVGESCTCVCEAGPWRGEQQYL